MCEYCKSNFYGDVVGANQVDYIVGGICYLFFEQRQLRNADSGNQNEEVFHGFAAINLSEV